MPKTELMLVLRLLIEQPVTGVAYSLQAKDDAPLDPKASLDGEPLAFEFQARLGPDRRLSGDQVRREGAGRRFVYVRVGQLAGDPSSPWSRRMKIDIHDIDDELLDRSSRRGEVIETVLIGTGKDGTPSCGTVKAMLRRIAER